VISQSAPRRLLHVLTLLAFLAAGSIGSIPIAESAAGHPLKQSIDAVLHGGDMAGCAVGMRVVDADTGHVLFDHDADRPLKPASNMKVMTSAAALSLLRPEYVFNTEFYASARPVDGVVAGDLYIKGYGSPSLSGEQWWLMAREIRARGVTRIEGDLVGDDTYFDAVERPEGWPSPTEDAFYNAPVSALSADYNAVTIVVRPTREGSEPEVFLTPFSSFFKVANKAMTRGSRSNLRVGRQFDGSQNTIVVEGNISARSAPSVSYRSVEQPTLYALAAFREAASKEGIVIKGLNRRGLTPDRAVKIYEHESRPLSDLVRIMNKLSNNYMAESFLKTLGAETAGPPGTSLKGALAISAFLEGLGVDTSRLKLTDGSGLSHANRLTAASLASLLVAMYGDFESYPEFMSSLAVGGVDGTLDRRMVGGPAQRRIRAKTGHLNGVSALSGYAFSQQGRVLAFSILVNEGRGADSWKVRRGIDRLCTAMIQADLSGAEASAARRFAGSGD